LLRLIDDILDFSKIEAGQLEIQPENASLQEMLRKSTAMYYDLALKKGISLDLRIDPALSPRHVADEFRVSQIVNNLLSNAIKFTAKGGVVLEASLIERNNYEERICIRVEDSGIGVSPEQQARLFKPFSQADSNTTRKYGGTGLGLSICASLAELMGGSIKMASALGKGTSMTLLLEFPVVAAQDNETSTQLQTAPAWPATELPHGRILIAEDHPVNRNLVMRQIRTLGYEADHADDGVEALAKWQSASYAMVLTDCHMPNMDGYQLAREIRRIEQERSAVDGLKRHIAIIACTASALAGDAELCFAAGMDGYLAKPVGVAQLRDALERWLVDQTPSTKPAFGETLKTTKPSPQRQQSSTASALDGASDITSPLDLSALAQFTGGDKSVERDIIAQFLSATRDDANALRAAVAQGDADAIARAAHRVKGAARMMGAGPVANVSERIEQAGKSGDMTMLTSSMVEFNSEHARLLEYLAGPPA
jgi:CheY-like chemotaxis protein/HPt (histidine-containing phosphotransfer) domain-containing protein/two-component sensor histidine kinase